MAAKMQKEVSRFLFGVLVEVKKFSQVVMNVNRWRRAKRRALSGGGIKKGYRDIGLSGG